MGTEVIPPFVILNNAEWYKVTGRGTVAAFDRGVVEELGLDSPVELLYQRVFIDDALYEVRGVEMQVNGIGAPRYKGPFGLLVRRVDDCRSNGSPSGED